MKEKRITKLDFLTMTKNEYKGTLLSLEVHAYRLLGIPWKKWIKVFKDIKTGDLVFQYE